MADLTTEDMIECMREAGVPVLVTPRQAADLARGLGIKPYHPPKHDTAYVNLAADFARRLRQPQPTGAR